MSDENLPEELWSMKEPFKPKWSCPSDHVIASYLDATLREEERSRLEFHLAKCRHCRQVLGDTIKVQREIEPTAPPFPLFSKAIHVVPTKAVSRARFLIPAGAVVIIVAVAAATIVLRHQEQTGVLPPQPLSAPLVAKSAVATNPKPRVTDVERSLPIASRSLRITFPRAGDVFKAGPLQIRWTGIRDANSYEVTILAVDGDLVWKGETRELALALPTSVSLKDGTYFISATSYLSNGRAVKSTPISIVVKR